MARRLVIDHGDRTTRHDLDAGSLVIGRDPSCDLFFADPKLSRRHARIVCDAEGVVLVDLGSRNGSWVNDVQVDEARLAHGDRIRLGGLRVVFEDEEEAEEISRTVVLGGSGEGPEPGAATIAAGSDETERTDETVLLAGPAAAEEDEPGTLVYAATPAEGDGATTRVAEPTDTAAESVASAEESTVTVVPGAEEADSPGRARARWEAFGRWLARRNRAVRLAALIAGVALWSALVLALPSLLRVRGELAEESLRRGRALARLLAARAPEALASSEAARAVAEALAAEPGVVDAILVGTDDRIVLPAERAGAPAPAAEGLDRPWSAIETLRLVPAGTGVVLIGVPVNADGERVATAVLAFAPSRGEGVGTLVLVGLLLVGAGTVAAVAAARRMLFAPLEALAADVDAAAEDRGRGLSVAAGPDEIGALAGSLRRLIDRRGGAPSAVGRLVVDEALRVMEVDAGALAILGAEREAVVARGLAEAIRDPAMRGVVVELVEAARAESGETARAAWVEGINVRVAVEREASDLVVSLMRP